MTALKGKSMSQPDQNEVNAWAAAQSLNIKLPGKSPAYWHRFLTNNRRRDRAVLDSIPFRRAARTVLYHLNDLTGFAERELARRSGNAARPKLDTHGSREGKGAGFRWAVAGRHAIDEGEGSVLLKVSGIKLGLSLTPGQARALADQLMQYADKLEATVGGGR
jgi:hypothetical protein